MTLKASISLTVEQRAFARSLVAQGRYPSISAVFQRGLEMLRRDVEAHAAEIRALQALTDRRRSEPPVPLEGSTEQFVAALARDE